MRDTFLVIIAGTLVLTQFAQANGCYVRQYSAADLAAHPEQIVAAMRMRIGVDKFRNLGGVMDAVIADRGRARAGNYGGRTFVQYLNCSNYDGVVKCSAECDSGLMTILRKDDAALEFSTRRLVVGNRTEACSTETVNLAGSDGGAVTYRLDRAADTACKGL